MARVRSEAGVRRRWDDDVDGVEWQQRQTITDTDALAALAQRGRVIAIEDIQQITREVNERLDALVEQRGLMS
jgi:hypothetical protein